MEISLVFTNFIFVPELNRCVKAKHVYRDKEESVRKLLWIEMTTNFSGTNFSPT